MRPRYGRVTGLRCEGVEPCDAEESGVEGVDDRVDGVQVCQQERLEGALQSDMSVEECCGDQGNRGVEVHGQLPSVDVCARDEGEQSVDARHLVDDLQEGDDFGASAEGHFLKESLRIMSVGVVLCIVGLP